MACGPRRWRRRGCVVLAVVGGFTSGLGGGGASAASVWTIGLRAGSGAQAASRVPVAPASVTATCAGLLAGSVNLSWPAVAADTGYNVYQATAQAGPYTQVASATGASATVTPGAGTFYWEISGTDGAAPTAWESASRSAPTTAVTLTVLNLVCTGGG